MILIEQKREDLATEKRYMKMDGKSPDALWYLGFLVVHLVRNHNMSAQVRFESLT